MTLTGFHSSLVENVVLTRFSFYIQLELIRDGRNHLLSLGFLSLHHRPVSKWNWSTANPGAGSLIGCVFCPQPRHKPKTFFLIKSCRSCRKARGGASVANSTTAVRQVFTGAGGTTGGGGVVSPDFISFHLTPQWECTPGACQVEPAATVDFSSFQPQPFATTGDGGFRRRGL